ncbi:hypothetical protein BV22DRAFT_1009230, partial [Leucogyrophana mollusca]
FVVISLLHTRHHTPVQKRTPNPAYASKDATFDFPIFLSTADRLGSLEVVVWDRETLLTKEYLGEVALPLGEWFAGREGADGYGFGEGETSANLVSTRASTHVSGSVQIKLGFVPAPGTHSAMEFDEVFEELVKRSRPSLVSAPPVSCRFAFHFVFFERKASARSAHTNLGPHTKTTGGSARTRKAQRTRMTGTIRHSVNHNLMTYHSSA